MSTKLSRERILYNYISSYFERKNVMKESTFNNFVEIADKDYDKHFGGR